MTKTEQRTIDKVLSGEHWKDNLSGLKWNKTLEEACMLKHAHEIRLFRAKEDIREIEKLNALEEMKAYQERALNRLIDASCVAVLRSKNDPRIKEIGFNDPEDMFLNNWGTLLAAIIHGNQGGIAGYVLYDETNTARTSDGTYAPSFSNQSTTTYFTIQFGSGTTAAARNNYAIQTAFATPPESTKFQCGPGAYASGVISFGNLVTAGGSGTINEIGLFAQQRMSDAAYRHYMITHDILSSGVAFVAGNPLVGTFAINI